MHVMYVIRLGEAHVFCILCSYKRKKSMVNNYRLWFLHFTPLPITLSLSDLSPARFINTDPMASRPFPPFFPSLPPSHHHGVASTSLRVFRAISWALYQLYNAFSRPPLPLFFISLFSIAPSLGLSWFDTGCVHMR